MSRKVTYRTCRQCGVEFEFIKWVTPLNYCCFEHKWMWKKDDDSVSNWHRRLSDEEVSNITKDIKLWYSDYKIWVIHWISIYMVKKIKSSIS